MIHHTHERGKIMTNQQIIFNAEQELAEQGKINYTGRVFEMETADGSKITLKETEEIHTYQTWKALGFQVSKGQKAVTKLTIWKHTTKHNKETDQDESKMFMKTAAFFSRGQVEAIA